MSRLFHRGGHIIGAVACVAGVPAIVLVLVRLLFDVPISSFRPVLNDEVAYWHQALTFTRAGLSGGYYTLGELTNPSGPTWFGPHGPGFPVAYGIFGTLFGWHRHSVVLLNLAAIAAATSLWLSLTRVRGVRLLATAVLLATFWQMTFWAPTGMQEGLHHAGAIAMAAFFAHALAPGRRTWVLVAGSIALAILSFIRPSWVVLIPVFAIVAVRPRGRAALAASLAVAFAASLAIVVVYSHTTAPFPSGFFFLKVFDLSISSNALWSNLSFNIQKTIALGDYTPLEILHRVQYWSWLTAACVTAAILRWRTSANESRPETLRYMLAGAAAMALALVLMLLLYTLTNWAEHRVLSAFLLFASLLCVAAPGRLPLLLVTVLIASNIAATSVFVTQFRETRHDNFVWDRRGVYELSDAIANTLTFRPTAPRWCNTLLTAQYPPHLIAIPGGIGLSVVREPKQLPLPPHSQYLLLDSNALQQLAHPIRLEPLATLPYGVLYRNLESGCP